MKFVRTKNNFLFIFYFFIFTSKYNSYSRCKSNPNLTLHPLLWKMTMPFAQRQLAEQKQTSRNYLAWLEKTIYAVQI